MSEPLPSHPTTAPDETLARGSAAMSPTEIFSALSKDVIGQESTLRFVSVAIFKHIQGEPFGNLLMIGSSGTGKTTTMRAMERLYSSTPAFESYRTVIILNANILANDEGTVDTTPLLLRLEERARQILGENALPQEIGRLMQHATVCIDEVDKVSAVVGGRPFVTGINIQQALLTLIEGETLLYPVRDPRGGPSTPVEIDTGRMLFLCAGAFETLYDQVFRRVISPKSGIKLPTTTTYEDGKVQIREHFTLVDHFKLEDLFDYGMQPQFLSRFDNAIILEDLNPEVLRRIFLETRDSVFQRSRNFFKRYGIELEITDDAARRIAREASKSSRIGARALKTVYGRIIKPFEFDPFSRPEVTGNGRNRRLVIDKETVVRALHNEAAP
jgi:ATP-dependent Clp protease ATP-binding subunit ClpX